MSGKRYTDEFKIEAVKQVTERGYKITEDDELAIAIKAHWLESGCVYGYRNITKDLKGEGKSCGKNRVLRVMRREGLKALIGYKRRPVFIVALSVIRLQIH
jgi:hypothetical protein